jgi:hypothetical protein
VYLLREDVVRAQLEGKGEDDVIARACYFGDLHFFYANDRDIGNDLSAVRGVRRGSVAEGDGQKVPCAPQETDSIRTAYDTLGRVSADEAAGKLRPNDAAQLSAIVASYCRLQTGQ